MMERLVQLKKILLVLLATVCATHAAFEQNAYTELDLGQNITGTAGAKLITESNYDYTTR